VFSTIFSGTLADVAETANQGDIPIETYSVAGGDFSTFGARHVKFVATSVHAGDSRAGLSEIMIFGVVPEPSAFTLAAFGLLGLLGCGRRKRPRI